MAAILKLVQNFQQLFDEGYCEEDILDAFIASLNRQSVIAEDDFSAELLQTRMNSLQEIANAWVEQNNNNNLED